MAIKINKKTSKKYNKDYEERILKFKDIEFHYYPNWWNNNQKRRVKLLDITAKDKTGKLMIELNQRETEQVIKLLNAK